MEKNFTIPAFAEPITALADTPACSAAELKRRFQAPAEELRQAHNALAACVEGITDATYPETVTEDMLTADLAGKINAKADEASVSERLAAETAARESLGGKVLALEQAAPQKCEVVFGEYIPSEDTTTDYINLGFQPKGVILFPRQIRSDWSQIWMFWPGAPVVHVTPYDRVRTTSNGFAVDWWSNRSSNGMVPYRYLAFK